MARQLPNLTNTPPGGWRYAVPEVGGSIIGPFSGWIQLRDNVLIRYKAAGYEPPSDLFGKVQEYICQEEPEYCGDAPKPGIVGQVIMDTRHTFHAVMQCLATLVSNRAGSGEKPTMEQQEARAQVCAVCPKNKDIVPCSTCSIKSLQRLVKKLVGAKVTSVDSKLKFCEVCHCSNAAKIATKHEAIWKHMPDRQKAQLPDACWIASEAKQG